jgi:hypothetical protein
VVEVEKEAAVGVVKVVKVVRVAKAGRGGRASQGWGSSRVAARRM